jgi:hypothetical protein
MSGVRPCGWTDSRGRFDRLPGVLFLELHRAEIAERGMQSSDVVDLVDEAGGRSAVTSSNISWAAR